MAPVDAGFEALLRPVQDFLTRNWDIGLTECLEDYLCHLKVDRGDPETNFSEAALVVQNSTHFYSKRVDQVFDFMIKLTDIFQTGEDEEAPVEDNAGGHSRKKKTPKVLRNDSLPELESLISDINIDLKSDKKPKSEKKQVILNTSAKVMTKENINCKVFNSKGLEMGYKYEFRLHWKIHSDGMLKEDFCGSTDVTLVHREDDAVDIYMSCDGINSSDVDIARGNDDCDERDIDVSGHPCSPAMDVLDEPAAIDDQEPSPLNPVDPLVNPKNDALNKPVKNVWQMLSENLKVNEMKIKKKRTFTLPKCLVEEASSTRSVRKRKRDSKADISKEVPPFLFHFELCGEKEPISMIDFERRKEQGKKSDLLKRRQLDNQMAVLRAAKEFDGDFQGFDNDNADDYDCCNDDDGGDVPEVGDPLPEIDLGLVNPTDAQGVPLDANYEREENSQTDTYERDAYLTMKQYQKGKTDNTNMVSEIAKRVQAWHESLLPILERAEARTKFNIHDYGTSILEKFTENNESDGEPQIKTFAEITAGQPKEEISRYFLSALMLANTYNIEIVKTDTSDLAIDCMNLKLLSRVRHHEEMDDNLRATSKDCGH